MPRDKDRLNEPQVAGAGLSGVDGAADVREKHDVCEHPLHAAPGASACSCGLRRNGSGRSARSRSDGYPPEALRCTVASIASPGTSVSFGSRRIMMCPVAGVAGCRRAAAGIRQRRRRPRSAAPPPARASWRGCAQRTAHPRQQAGTSTNDSCSASLLPRRASTRALPHPGAPVRRLPHSPSPRAQLSFTRRSVRLPLGSARSRRQRIADV